MRCAEVAVKSPLTQPRTFTYAVPQSISLTSGHAVWVPFGSRMAQGIVFQVGDEPVVEEVREITSLIDPHPLLLPPQIELARWIAQNYLSSFFEAAALMLPPGFERRMLTFLQPLSQASALAASSLTPAQRRLLFLLDRKGRVEMGEIKKALGRKEAEATSRQLLRKGLIARTQELERVKVAPKMVPYLRLGEGAGEAFPLLERRAPKQAALLKLLAGRLQPLSLPEVRGLGFTPAVIKALRGKDMVSLEEVRVSRDPLAHRTFERSAPPPLTPAQESAWRQIEGSLTGSGGDKRVFLLHGATGSGKTEIYLRALAHAVSLGRRGIVLVPEIALTPQTIDRFAARFPGRVAVLHSQLSLGERFDEWQRIREGAFDVVIGSRGAIFAPQPNLGLIVIDEEHEWTYKQQDQAPRYHAREVALKLAQLTGAVVILGSATPDVVSYHRTQRGEFRLLELPQRVTGSGGYHIQAPPALPRVEVVDLRRELKEGNRSIFSRALTSSLAETLEAGEQAILFLNRRGAATFVQCRDCGYVLRCRRCHVSLTYHSAEEDLVCHQCNYRSPTPELCPQCWSKRIKFLGVGTQKVEEEARRLFAEARLLRWDRDVTRGRRSHEQILDRFVAHEADILIGTQMIAKGLDLPLVTLVGVISADINLHLPDFRAGERTFQLLTQVAGRAGRGLSGGRVIIQTYTPDHYAVAAAARHDYKAFYEKESGFRREYENPPFSRLARLLYTHTNEGLCQREAQRMYQTLEGERESWGLGDISLIGPSPAYMRRVRGRFRWQVIIRAPDPLRLLSQVPLPQGWAVDIDPVSLL